MILINISICDVFFNADLLFDFAVLFSFSATHQHIPVIMDRTIPHLPFRHHQLEPILSPHLLHRSQQSPLLVFHPLGYFHLVFHPQGFCLLEFFPLGYHLQVYHSLGCFVLFHPLGFPLQVIPHQPLLQSPLQVHGEITLTILPPVTHLPHLQGMVQFLRQDLIIQHQRKPHFQRLGRSFQ